MELRTRMRASCATGCGIVALGIGAPAHADWAGKGEAGLLLSRGNAEATSGNLKLDVANEHDLWKNAFYVAGLYSRNATFTTAERIEGRYQLDYKLSARLYTFFALRGERDLFSGFAYQVTASAGAGYKFIDEASLKLAGIIGVGYRRMQPEQLVKDSAGQVIQRIPGDVSGNVVGTGGLSFEYQATKTTKIIDKLLVESGSANTSVANDFAVQVSMTDKLALAFGYGVRYNSNPPPGSKTTDQQTTVNVVYNIK